MSQLHETCFLVLVLIHMGSAEGNPALGGSSIVCRPSASCEECIKSQPDCAWCKQQNFSKAGEPDSTRCDSEASLRRRGCEAADVVNPRSAHQVTKSRALGEGAGGEGVVQLAPQKISLKLRPGKEVNFTVRFRRAEGYPVDLYYLMDLSYSMKDDLENIKKLGNDLLIALKNVTQSVKIGFGSFVDKTLLPYISMLPQKRRNPCPDRTEQCQPPFSFRNVLPLTDDATEFEERVSQQNISGNLDPPEGGFDAMMQAAVCGREVGWRNVTRLLVYTSDAAFHMAGDGKLGGVYLPNDGRCHLDQNGLYAESERYDYPSVGHLAQILSQQNIQPIFAVTEKTLSTYQELGKLIPKSVVGELKEDSSNVLQLITEAYNNLSSTINLEHSKLPDGLSVRFESHCGNRTIVHSGRGECSNVHINEEITFTVTVSASHCLRSEKQFEMRILGFTEKLEIRVETVCGCDCGDSGSESSSEYCSQGNGTLNCGQCSCRAGRVGKFCECSQGELGVLDLTESCRRETESAVCGGRGQCLCGRCVCSDQLHGEFCECDDSSCVRHNNQLCSGNGRCSCGQCECNSDYTGESCDCSTLKTSCLLADGSVCSGHGDCKCNRCECESGYQGTTCDTCVTCPNECERLRDCAVCLAFGSGPEDESCERRCVNMSVEVVQKLPQAGLLCTERAANNELIEFVVEQRDTGTHFRVRQRVSRSDRKYMVISSVMTGIVLIGLMALLVWRLVTQMVDRREYKRFVQEQQNAKWNETRNPLFKSACTTVVNPQFQED